MKKSYFSLLIAAGVLLTACNGAKVDQTDPEAIKTEAIKEADEAVTLEASPELGTLPALCARMEAARDSVRALTQNPKLEEKRRSDDEKAREQIQKIASAGSTAREEITNYYTNLMQEELNKLAGKEIPLQFDTTEFSSGKAVLTDELSQNDVYVEYEMVLAKTISMFEDKGIELQYLDKEGNVIKTIYTSHKIWPDTYSEDGTNIIKAIPGAIWKSTLSLYIPNAAEMTSIKISIKK